MKENARAGRLFELYDRIRKDPSYRNQSMGKIFVPGEGAIGEGAIVLVGEAPGREEEKEQSPFVGPAGQNLNQLLASIHLSRRKIFITNLIKYRPLTPEGLNRNPTAAESRSALPYLLEELEILAPGLVVCLGLSSAKAILQRFDLKMSEANGSLYQKHGFRILVTYHPSPFNYMKAVKREAMYSAFARLGEILPERS